MFSHILQNTKSNQIKSNLSLLFSEGDRALINFPNWSKYILEMPSSNTASTPKAQGAPRKRGLEAVRAGGPRWLLRLCPVYMTMKLHLWKKINNGLPNKAHTMSRANLPKWMGEIPWFLPLHEEPQATNGWRERYRRYSPGTGPLTDQPVPRGQP